MVDHKTMTEEEVLDIIRAEKVAMLSRMLSNQLRDSGVGVEIAALALLLAHQGARPAAAETDWYLRIEAEITRSAAQLFMQQEAAQS